jgi:hypothetical protein
LEPQAVICGSSKCRQAKSLEAYQYPTNFAHTVVSPDHRYAFSGWGSLHLYSGATIPTSEIYYFLVGGKG